MTESPTSRTGNLAQRNDTQSARADKDRFSRVEVLRRVEKALEELEYGTIEVKVEAGKLYG